MSRYACQNQSLHSGGGASGERMGSAASTRSPSGPGTEGPEGAYEKRNGPRVRGARTRPPSAAQGERHGGTNTGGRRAVPRSSEEKASGVCGPRVTLGRQARGDCPAAPPVGGLRRGCSGVRQLQLSR